jgi:hypothetical protein
MYMFTQFYDDDHAYEFEGYKQVLVTFHNPVDDPELTLKYTGTGKDINNVFPKALDTMWIKNGKIVPDFYNEIATPNPYVFEGVHSLKDLPPVMQIPPYEEGSFGLEPQKTFTFKFSREVLVDDAGSASLKVIGYVNGEVWTPSFNNETNELTLTCPGESYKTLSGDVEIKIIQIYGKGTDKGVNVVMHYNFGAISRTFEAQEVAASDWRSEITIGNAAGTWARPIPTSLWAYNVDDNFVAGTGDNKNNDDLSKYTKNGLYKMPDGSKIGDCFFYLTGRKSGKYGNLYTVEHLAAGNYSFNFYAMGWANTDCKTQVYVYAKPAEMTYDNLQAVTNKTQIGECIPSKQTSWSDNNEARDCNDNFEQFEYMFSVPAEGDYVIEWRINGRGTSYYGIAISNYTIKTAGDQSYAYTKALNEAVEKGQERAALANEDADLYGGTFLETLEAKIAYYAIGGEFDGLKLQKPTEWEAAAKDMEAATDAMKLRMDTVDKFVETRNNVVTKLADDAKYEDLAAYKALNDLSDEAEAYPVTTKSGPEIYAFNKQMDDAIAALDARVAVNKAFEDAIAEAKSLIGKAEKPDYAEFTALEDCYDAYELLDIITPSDVTPITDATAAVVAATNAYKSKVQGASVLPTRVNALYNLAKELDPEDTKVVRNGVLLDRLDKTDFDDDDLADIYKTAIKIALYDLADAKDAKADSVDLTPFIKNYHLYQTYKVVERTDKNMPDNAGAGADPDGAQIQHTQHKWNSGDLNGKMPIWVMITGVDYTDLYPGWTVTAYAEGNAMVTGDQSYKTYANGITIFDAEIGMDWNGKAEMKQDVADLPVGMYTLGVELKEFTPSASDGKIARLTITTPDTAYVGEATEKGAQTLAVDSIMVADNDTVNIFFMLRSQNGWSRADNFSLTFWPSKTFDYAEAAGALEAKLDELMTVVDARKAVQAGVEYYTIGGIKLDAPKAGQILIRKTTQNGKVVVDKVLIK